MALVKSNIFVASPAQHWGIMGTVNRNLIICWASLPSEKKMQTDGFMKPEMNRTAKGEMWADRVEFVISHIIASLKEKQKKKQFVKGFM